MEMLSGVKKFISYWYFRYLIVTELYMVEPWEKVATHVLFGALFFLMWYFNYTILLSGISKFVGLVQIFDDTDVPQTT